MWQQLFTPGCRREPGEDTNTETSTSFYSGPAGIKLICKYIYHDLFFYSVDHLMIGLVWFIGLSYSVSNYSFPNTPNI